MALDTQSMINESIKEMKEDNEREARADIKRIIKCIRHEQDEIAGHMKALADYRKELKDFKIEDVGDNIQG